jgi:antitoxin HicB
VTAMNWTYGVRITEIDGDFVVSVRDLPEVVTSGDTMAEAIELAGDAMGVIVAGRIEDELPLPPPTSVIDGEMAVPLAPRVAVKASVYHLWREAKISKSELARRMGRTETEARRILSARSRTKLDQMAEAARALGGRLVIGVA